MIMGKKKPEKFINGSKIYYLSFKSLRPKDFDYEQDKKSFVNEPYLISRNGTVFINDKIEFSDYITSIMRVLEKAEADHLSDLLTYYESQYPDIKTFEDLTKLVGDDKAINRCVSMLLIPLECKRREIEERYYRCKLYAKKK